MEADQQKISEFRAIWKRAPKKHKPTSLVEVWGDRMDPNPSVEKLIAVMRDKLSGPELDDSKRGHFYFGRFMVGILQRFERLVEAGKLDAVLPELSGLPVLYTPNAGKGAGEWQYAASLFMEKHVGRDCILEYRNRDSELARNPIWRHLAYDTVWVVQHAVLEMPNFRALREMATDRIGLSRRRSERARRSIQNDFFLLPNEEVLMWPDWLDKCDAIPRRRPNGLPLPVREAVEPYLEAARAVLDSFFADPGNPFAAKIVDEVTGTRKDLPRAQAVAEARKNVLAAIKRL